MRSAAAILIGLVAAAVLGLAAAALLNERAQAFTLGVTRSSTLEVDGGQEICQSPIAVPADGAFDGVTFAVGTEHRPGPRVDVIVRAADPDRPSALRGVAVGRGSLPAGYPDVDRVPEHTVWTGRVGAERFVAVCVANRGPRRVFVYGNADAAAWSSTAFVDGAPVGADMALEFERREPRSLAALAPAMIDRAALFSARAVGAWTYVALGLLVLLVVPALLVLA